MFFNPGYGMHSFRVTGVEERAQRSCCSLEPNKPFDRRTFGRALGAGLIFEAAGNMITDVGGGTTDIAVLSWAELTSQSPVAVISLTKLLSAISARSIT